MDSKRLVTLTRRLSERCAELSFAPPVAHVYNPLDYARAPLERYLTLYGRGPKELLLLGMNPGPFGMVQTGVPFGEVAMARDFLRCEAVVRKPAREHAARPITGFACTRSEVSGARLWGWVRKRFGSPEAFFAKAFVWNYCPLAFLEESGRNLTPDKLPRAEREPLFAACDEALRMVVEVLAPKVIVGVGQFAEAQARKSLPEDAGLQFTRVPHPSPASPLANRGWDALADAALAPWWT